jgi:nicotinamide mononucleotide adenylyltransferase
MTDTGVIHGRFQVLHKDHMKYILAGKNRCKHLIVGITNPDPSLVRHDPSNEARSDAIANPLTYYERYVMIREALLEAGIQYPDFSIVPLPINVPELFKHYVPRDALFFLTIYDDWGRRKLALMKSLGLKTEVMWNRSLEEKGITGSYVRDLMTKREEWEHFVPPSVAHLMNQWNIPDRIRNMACESG